ncbi:lytic transglycosylase domain-containing protein [Porphyrobacter sp. ULC335]|uniref:lytic transglycosylase domain-containing protein n=1 Tax=Porphyrobacter sp. ULC335 TaxID=2854260 RepID=UPI002220D2B4|nr:lytic transglycosylase domain-containing protein [Porphyrobacter sp. ULC335]UYV15502.1 lytic transglycosylase domain-containing protein [Porphyrobacter sp. ULC335]
MILAAGSRAVITAAAIMLAAEARADVLELGSDGARWVSGPLAGQPAVADPYAPAAAATDAEMLEAPALPDVVIADPARHAAGIPPRYAAKIAELAARFDLSPSLLEALVWQESRWREDAVSPVGAQGLAQLMPGTARYLGVDPRDPFANLEGGARYLREQLDRFGGDLEKALAAYNAGPGRVERAGGIPNIRETKQYVAAIIGRLANHSRPPAP